MVFVAISMVVLTGFLAMTLDVGSGNRTRRVAQTAADAAALAGGSEIFRLIYDEAEVEASARAEATRNGFTDGVDGVSVDVNYHPETADNPAYNGNPQYVEVLIRKTIPTIFGRFLDVPALNVAVKAVAGVGSYSLNCVYTLDPSGPQSINVSNGGELTTNCGVVVNSSHNNALSVNQSGILDSKPSGSAVVGGWSGNKTPTPAPSTGAAPVNDPLSHLVPPTVGGCTHTGLLTLSAGTHTLNPGVYCGGILIQSGSATANLNPGVYVLKGGLEVRNSGVINGTGVMFYNTFDATYPYKPFVFAQGCKAKLSAPTAGDYTGILMYQDPAAVLAPGDKNIFACAATVPPELTGSLYFPTQSIEFNGSDANTQILGSVIAKQVIIGGKIEILNQTTGSTALKRLSLVQ